MAKAKKPVSSIASKSVRAVGRPTDYSKAKSDLICSLISDGHSLRRICSVQDMPNMVTIFRWLREHEEFSNQYRVAKKESADAMQEDMLHIADEDPQLLSAGDGKDGEGAIVKIDGAFERWRLTRIQTRQWIAARLEPKKYGDKISQELSGPDGKALPMVAPVINLTLTKGE